MSDGHNLSQRAAAQIAQGLRDVKRLKGQLITPHRGRWQNGTQANASTSTASGNCGCTVVRGVVDTIYSNMFGTQKLAYRWRLTGIEDWLDSLGCDTSDLAMVFDPDSTPNQSFHVEFDRTCGSFTDEYTLVLTENGSVGWSLALQLSGGVGTNNCDTEIRLTWRLQDANTPQWNRTQGMQLFAYDCYSSTDGDYEDPPDNCVFCLEPVKELICVAGDEGEGVFTDIASTKLAYDSTDTLSGSPSYVQVTRSTGAVGYASAASVEASLAAITSRTVSPLVQGDYGACTDGHFATPGNTSPTGNIPGATTLSSFAIYSDTGLTTLVETVTLTPRFSTWLVGVACDLTDACLEPCDCRVAFKHGNGTTCFSVVTDSTGRSLTDTGFNESVDLYINIVNVSSPKFTATHTIEVSFG